MTLKTRLTVMTMAIGIFLCMLDTTIMNIALPAIQSGLHVSLASLSWALNVYTITFAVFTIPLGRLSDQLGRHKVYIAGLALFLIGSLVSGSATSMALLISGRALQSLGAAIVFPASMTIGITTVDLAHRTPVVATLGLTQGLAAALGPTLGGIITQFLGWRWVFFINVPLVILAIGLSLWLLQLKNESRTTAKIDGLGMVLSMILLFSLTLALVQGSDWGWSSLPILSLFAISLVSLVAFIVAERFVKDPMIPLTLFAHRQFAGAVFAIVITGIFLVAVMVIFPTFCTKVQGKTELAAALMITPASVMIFLLAPISGNIIDKIGPRVMVATGFILMILGYATIFVMNPNQYAQVVIALLFIGAGFGLVAGPIVVLGAADFTGDMLTASQSVLGLFRQIGTVLAVAIFVSALTANLKTAKTTAINDTETYVQTLALPQTAKHAMVTNATAQIKSENPSDHHAAGISKATEARLIEENYQTAVKKAGGAQLPTSVKQAIRFKVTHAVQTKVTKDNAVISKASTHIKHTTKQHIVAAFMSPYKLALPFLVLASLTSLLFYRRKDYRRVLADRN
ncbi:MFS transporter [Secundilactobacillus paracollinoides]|uniref:MFS transporter n=1 Tax=Secundilactobacillus paracollinoides TaxID=240427 RepID=A0A1B2IXZ8_9LACO|nr:MFS transporter [Secundilactobacillus paracollinoides]ANZ61023.1 MFS transporter [Secundilactobacillus paracollinoides]ANZ64554.1 MFS transporter [Secundilactobacillus paracollinoides]ANZ66945.1 MFS transporter [Secundilactobacillus paracollinoides]